MISLKDFALPEYKHNSHLNLVETNELKCGDFVLIITPETYSIRRNATIGRISMITEVNKPTSDEKIVIIVFVHGRYEETFGPVDEKTKEGYTVYKLDVTMEGDYITEINGLTLVPQLTVKKKIEKDMEKS